MLRLTAATRANPMMKTNVRRAPPPPRPRPRPLLPQPLRPPARTCRTALRLKRSGRRVTSPLMVDNKTHMSAKIIHRYRVCVRAFMFVRACECISLMHPLSLTVQGPFGLPAQLRLAALARRRERTLRARSDRYLYTLYTVAVFYALPVVQFVLAFQIVTLSLYILILRQTLGVKLENIKKALFVISCEL